MNIVFSLMCCLLAVVPIRGHDWSRWYDRDNPSATGDWETLGSQKKLGYVCDGCKPIAAECRVKGTENVFTRWTGSAPDTLTVPCSPTKGVACKNSDQGSGGYCSDYEIRYLCPTTDGTWTNYLNRDNPRGTGDWESVSSFRNTDGNNLCSGQRPLCTKCRVKSNKLAYYNTRETFNDGYDCKWDAGLVCTTAVNGRRCKNYEVNFKCARTSGCGARAKWTGWLSRDLPSYTADNEKVGPGLHNPCSSQEPIDIECRVKANKEKWDATGQVIATKCTPSEGFLCLNADQPSGQYCKDYEVRFLCP